MQEIDWSKAPEGASHYYGHLANPWLMENSSGRVYFWTINGVWEAYPYHAAGKAHIRSAIPRPAEQPATWTGEGLPPVGAPVEAMCTAKTKARDWFPAEVKYISPYTVVLTDYSTEELDGEFVAHPATLVFRPIPTPEQIAAEEREKAIQEMTDIGIHAKTRWAEAIYDAGYRKVEGGAA